MMYRKHEIDRFAVRPVALGLMLAFLLSVLSFGASAECAVYHSAPDGKGKQIALTFDDGPHPSQTHRILEVLDRYGVKATFFMIGVNIHNYPQAAKEVIEAGHEVGNHTYSHVSVAGLSEGELKYEMEACEKEMDQLCSYRPHLFRPPQGALGASVNFCSERGDYQIVLWSIDTRDWEHKNASQIVNTVLSQVKDGDIILMHDYVPKSKTPEALEILLPKLLALGYEPVTVSELLGIG